MWTYKERRREREKQRIRCTMSFNTHFWRKTIADLCMWSVHCIDRDRCSNARSAMIQTEAKNRKKMKVFFPTTRTRRNNSVDVVLDEDDDDHHHQSATLLPLTRLVFLVISNQPVLSSSFFSRSSLFWFSLSFSRTHANIVYWQGKENKRERKTTLNYMSKAVRVLMITCETSTIATSSLFFYVISRSFSFQVDSNSPTYRPADRQADKQREREGKANEVDWNSDPNEEKFIAADFFTRRQQKRKRKRTNASRFVFQTCEVKLSCSLSDSSLLI